MENRIWINFDLFSYKVVFEVKIEEIFKKSLICLNIFIKVWLGLYICEIFKKNFLYRGLVVCRRF